MWVSLSLSLADSTITKQTIKKSLSAYSSVPVPPPFSRDEFASSFFFLSSALNKKSQRIERGEEEKKNLLMQSDSQNTSHSFWEWEEEAELEQTHTHTHTLCEHFDSKKKKILKRRKGWEEEEKKIKPRRKKKRNVFFSFLAWPLSARCRRLERLGRSGSSRVLYWQWRDGCRMARQWRIKGRTARASVLCARRYRRLFSSSSVVSVRGRRTKSLKL